MKNATIKKPYTVTQNLKYSFEYYSRRATV